MIISPVGSSSIPICHRCRSREAPSTNRDASTYPISFVHLPTGSPSRLSVWASCLGCSAEKLLHSSYSVALIHSFCSWFFLSSSLFPFHLNRTNILPAKVQKKIPLYLEKNGKVCVNDCQLCSSSLTFDKA